MHWHFKTKNLYCIFFDMPNPFQKRMMDKKSDHPEGWPLEFFYLLPYWFSCMR